MAPIFKYTKQLGNTGPPGYYQREGDDRCYQRIVAGFAPPSERPGAIVVVAEEMAFRPPAHIFWVDELQEHSLDRLFLAAVELKQKYNIDEFFGRVSDPNFLRSLSHWNNARAEKHMAALQLSAAPDSESGCISFHVNVLRQRLAPENKTLWLGNSEFLPAALQELPQSEVHAATDVNYPILSAVSYAVSALEIYAVNPYADTQPRFANSEYDPLNYFNKQEF